MFRDQNERFLFKAHAVGASGTFRKPHEEFLEAQASSALSIDGGVVSARVLNFNHRDIVSFRSASTHAVGQFDKDRKVWNTLVTATVQGLNILGVVTADRIVARLASQHFVDQREASILTIGSHIQNLNVAGVPVRLMPDPKVTRDWDTLTKAWAGCRDRRATRISRDGTMIATTIFPNAGCRGGGLLEPEDNVIRIAEFGAIHLGEIIISDGERRLTMMRVEFGCAIDGDTNVGEVGGNGHQVPPL